MSTVDFGRLIVRMPAFVFGGLIRTPTLVVAGADDGITPVAQTEEIARGIAGARLEILEKAGHQAPLEQSEAFNALVERFAESLA